MRRNVWATRLPDDLPEEVKCRFCEEPKQLLRLNDLIAFWVHTDIEQFRKCKYLTFRTSFIKNVMKTFKDIQDRNKFHMAVKNNPTITLARSLSPVGLCILAGGEKEVKNHNSANTRST